MNRPTELHVREHLTAEEWQVWQSRAETVEAMVREACHEAGRNPDEVKVLAVTKRKSLEEVLPLTELGYYSWAENRVQELREKQEELEAGVYRGQIGDFEPEWHLIGTLQKNKVKYLIGKISMLHSVDSYELAEEISRLSQKAGWTCRILLQVNYSGELSKHGFSPEELEVCWERLVALPNLELCGLMTMAPIDAPSEELHDIFGGLRRLFEERREALEAGHPGRVAAWKELSMGMSRDFREAIEEGATMIRLGTALVGPRPQ